MRIFYALLLSFTLAGCGLLGGSKTLTPADVAGRYEFTEFVVEPTAGSVDSKNLRRELGDDVTLLLTDMGSAVIQTTQGGTVGATLASGSFSIRGREVRVDFSDLGDLGSRVLMPRTISFDGGSGRLRADIFLEGANLEDVSDDYRGITRADARLKISLREIND